MLKKFLSSFLLVIAITSTIYGNDFRVPLDRDGKKAQSIKDAYVRVVSTGYTTNQTILLRGASIAIYGVLTSTKPAASDYAGVELRYSSTSGQPTSGELLVPPLSISTETRNTFYHFDPPIVCPGNLAVTLSSGGTFVSIFYNFLATSTKADFWNPYDMDNVKANSDFYGVKAASESAQITADIIGTEALDNTTGEKIVIPSRALFYGLMGGTVTTRSSFLVFEDTASVLGDPQNIFPPLFYKSFNVEDTNDLGKNTVVKFPWPILFRNGVGVTNSSADERIRVFVRSARSLRY